MSNEIIKVIDAIAAKFGIVIDWTAENVMPLVTETLEQLLLYKQISCYFWILIESLFFFIIPVIMSVIFYKSRQKAKETKENTCLWKWYRSYSENPQLTTTDESDFIISCIAMFAFIAIIGFIITMFTLLKITYAPNVYILEYLKSMI